METTALSMFHQTVRIDENENIWVKPVCDFFNLHVQNQYTKIKKDPILGKLYGKNSTDFAENEKLRTKNSTDLGVIDQNGRVLLSKKGFIRWIQIISPSSIDENLRPSFLIYQELVFDFLTGSAEEHHEIARLTASINSNRQYYSQIGNQIQTEVKQRENLLNRCYQYSLPFNGAKQLNG